MSDKLAALDARIEQLKARKAKILARQSEQDRKARARQAIIIGAWVQANRPELVEEIKAGLTRDQDRAAFGLEPLAEKPIQPGELAPTF